MNDFISQSYNNWNDKYIITGLVGGKYCFIDRKKKISTRSISYKSSVIVYKPRPYYS